MKPSALIVPVRWVKALLDEDEDLFNYSANAKDFVAFLEFAQDHLNFGFFEVDENSVAYYYELHDATEYGVPGCEVIDTVFTPYY